MYSREEGKETSLDKGKSILTKQNTNWITGASIKEFFLSEKSKCFVDLLPAVPQKTPTAVILLKNHLPSYTGNPPCKQKPIRLLEDYLGALFQALSVHWIFKILSFLFSFVQAATLGDRTG